MSRNSLGGGVGAEDIRREKATARPYSCTIPTDDPYRHGWKAPGDYRSSPPDPNSLQNRIIKELLQGAYADISNIRVINRLVITDQIGGFKIDIGEAEVVSVPKTYSIEGAVHASLLEREDTALLYRGIFAHELAHIALHHLERYSLLNELRRDVFSTREQIEKVFQRYEHQADEEAIRRGLGMELHKARAFYENLLKSNGLDALISPHHYSSRELEQLMSGVQSGL